MNSPGYIGISNENEFYSHHYLSEVFKGDIKHVLDGWQQRKDDESDHEDGFETPHQRLKGLARDYFIMRERMSRGLSNKERISMQREFFSQLLPALGFSWHQEQFHGSLPIDKAWLADDWNHLITNRIYGQPHPPRWVLLLSDSQLLPEEGASRHGFRSLFE